MGAHNFSESQFRENLRRERETRNWSQAHLAKLLSAKGLGVYPTTVAKIEAGERAARIDEVVAVADLLGVSVDALVGHRPAHRGGGHKSIAFGALLLLVQKMGGQVEAFEAGLRSQLLQLDGLTLRKDELAARAECERAADALADAAAAMHKAERRVSPVNKRFVSELLFDDSHNTPEDWQREEQ